MNSGNQTEMSIGYLNPASPHISLQPEFDLTLTFKVSLKQSYQVTLLK